MPFIEIGLVLSAFIGAVAIPLFPDPAEREGPQSAIWTLALALGAYILFLSICATLAPNFLLLVGASLAAAGAGLLCGHFAATAHHPVHTQQHVAATE